jgi:hypothetical protein
MATWLGFAATAGAAPDPAGAWTALVETPLRVSGDAAGSVGLLAGAGIGLAGDVIAVLDATWLPPGPLEGWVSGPVHRVAMAASWAGTSVLEALRGEDIERLPEHSATYRLAAPGVGRLDTLLAGGGALCLAAQDLVSGPILALLRGVGANGAAARLVRARQENRTRLLGPLSLPPGRPD